VSVKEWRPCCLAPPPAGGPEKTGGRVSLRGVAEGALREAHESREALQDLCGADQRPESWLGAFRRHEDQVSEAARDRLARAPARKLKGTAVT
jgi:hypothetical protein